jgi:GTP pyrophosphokinase
VARIQAGGSVEDLFASVGYGKIAASAVVRALRPDWKADELRVSAPKPRKLRDLFRREPRPSSTGIRVDGQGDVLIRFGRCCSPLPGDEVIGFVTRGRGVTVHQKNCRVTFELDPERRIDVQWDTDATVPHPIRIRVTSRDAPGLLAEITRSISAEGVNIGAAQVTTHPDRTATQNFELWITDVQVLNRVIKEIERVKGVISVERIRS